MRGTDLANKVFENGVAAGITRLAQLLVDLLGGEGMLLQQGGDFAAEGIQLAGPVGALALLVGGL